MIPGAPLVRARLGRVSLWCTSARHDNLADHVGDDPEAVHAARTRVAAQCGLPDPVGWVWLRQVHGARVVTVDEAPDEPPEADAAVTSVPGLPLAVVTADCAPVVLAARDAVGVVHAGHRGLAAGVVEAAVGALRAIGGGPISAYLGPCIRPGAYEFGTEDLDRIAAVLGPAVVARTVEGAPALDVPAAVSAALARVGVDAPSDCGACTATTPGYFSHRRDGATGRQVTVAVLR